MANRVNVAAIKKSIKLGTVFGAAFTTVFIEVNRLFRNPRARRSSSLAANLWKKISETFTESLAGIGGRRRELQPTGSIDPNEYDRVEFKKRAFIERNSDAETRMRNCVAPPDLFEQLAEKFLTVSQAERLADKKLNGAAKVLAATSACVDAAYTPGTPQNYKAKSMAIDLMAENIALGRLYDRPCLARCSPVRADTG